MIKAHRRHLLLILTICLGLLALLASGQVTTSTWADQSDGQVVHCLPGGCVTWPNNDDWTEDRVTGPHPEDSSVTAVLRPGNWTTSLYPDNGRGGVDYDVVVDTAPPVQLFKAVTINSINVAAAGVVNIRERATLTLRQNSVVDGVLRLNDTDPEFTLGNDATLRIDGDVALSGAGQVLLNTANSNNIESLDPADTLTLGSGVVLGTNGGDARGDVNVHLTNNGLLDVNGGAVRFVSPQKTLTNNTLIHLRNGGELGFSVGNVIENGLGTITIDPASELTTSATGVDGPTLIRGGLINGGGTMTVAGATILDGIGITLDNLTVTIGIGNSTSLTFRGDAVNNSTIRLNDTNTNQLARAKLLVDGNVSLSGTGLDPFCHEPVELD